MKAAGVSLVTQTLTLESVPFPIPGATPDGVMATLVNVDGDRGIVTTIIHIAPGARIPAHYHDDGAEAHYVIEGDFINGGQTLGPGAFVTHPKGVVHGPHESKTGCKILTLQTAYVDPANPDFHIAE
ncbi:MAG: cupin domain-containing protein [Chitinophagales bacterium]|nr:cupin domain-containing protein [Hyphomicrobiales bacterium]